MKESFIKSLLAIAVFLVTQQNLSAQKGNAASVYKKVNPAVVKVLSYNKYGTQLSQGSGVIVSDNGLIVTNLHLFTISETTVERIEVKHELKVFESEGVVAWDVKNDLLLLKVKDKNLHEIKLGNDNNVTIGEAIYAIGSPVGYENTISEGIVSGKRTEQNVTRLQITAPVSPGSSGGAIVNAKGELIGISNMIIGNAQNLNFAITVDEVKRLVATVDLNKPISKAALFIAAGDAMAGVGNYSKAISYFNKAKTIDNRSVNLSLARAYYEMRDLNNALLYANRSIKDNPSLLEAHVIKGKTFLNTDQTDSALYYADYVTGNIPCHGEALLLKSQVMLLKEQYHNAVSDAQKAIDCGETGNEALLQTALAYIYSGMNEKAMETLEKIASIENKTFTYWKNKATTLITEKHYANAIFCAEIAAALKPTAREPYSILSMAHTELKNYGLAKVNALKMIRVAPANAAGYGMMSTITYRLKDYNSCIDYTLLYIQKDSSVSGMYNRLATCYQAVKMKDSAEYYRSKYLAMENNAYYNYSERKTSFDYNEDESPIHEDNGNINIKGNSYRLKKNTGGCKLKIEGGYFSNVPAVLAFRNTPILIFEGWEASGIKHFDLDIYDNSGNMMATIKNSRLNNNGKFDLVLNDSECSVTNKETHELIFRAKKGVDNDNSCVIELWFNLFLPNGFMLKVTPESSNSNEYINGTRAIGSMSACLGFE